MTPTLEQNAWWSETIVKDIASCSLKKVSKHALLHITWDEPIFLTPNLHYQPATRSRHFLRDMTCNRPGSQNLLSRQSKFDQCGDGTRFRVGTIGLKGPSTTMFSVMLDKHFHREE